MAMNCERCQSDQTRLVPEIFGGEPRWYCDGCGHLWSRQREAVYTNDPMRYATNNGYKGEKVCTCGLSSALAGIARQSIEKEKDTYRGGAPMPQYAVLGVGAEAWVELTQAEERGKTRNFAPTSGVTLNWRTFQTVMNVLRAIRLKDFQEAEAAAGIASPSLQEQGWQPIETHGGSFDGVLVGGPDGVGEANYHHDEGGWWWTNNHPTDVWGHQIYPTHWQPLPLPPPSAKG